MSRCNPLWQVSWINILGHVLLPDIPRYSGMQSELDCWMEWIENSLADSAFEEQPLCDDLAEFMGGVSAMATPNGPMVRQPGLHISTELILRVEVVYVLGLFLVGKHRKKVGCLMWQIL